MNGTRIGHCGRRRTKQRAFVCSLFFVVRFAFVFGVFFLLVRTRARYESADGRRRTKEFHELERRNSVKRR